MRSKRSAHENVPLLTSTIVPGFCFLAAIIIASLTEELVSGIAMLCASGAVGVLFPRFLRFLDDYLTRKSALLSKIVQRILVIVLSGACFFLSYQNYMYGRQLKALTHCKPYPRDDGLIADFTTVPGGPARNALGLQFGLFSDSAWNKQSTLWFGTRSDEASGKDSYLSIVYQLISTDNTEPYCGIYTEFSPPPPISYDLSAYKRLSLKIRVACTDTAPRVAVAMDSENIHNYGYAFPVYDIPTNDVISEWVTVDIPFEAFQSPSYVSYEVSLDIARAYRVALILKGQPGRTIHGRLDVDEIRFLP